MLRAAFALISALSPQASAAPCCGVSTAAPTILTGDDRAQISASVSQSQVIGDAPAGGIPVFRADDDSEQTQTLKLEGAVLLSERWQAGASVPFLRRSHSTPESSSSAIGIGDFGFNVAFEALPEWEYSAWKPKGFLFVQLLVPTGGSIYETYQSEIGTQNRGFYTTGAGALLVKTWGDWDALAIFEGHRSFTRTFERSGGDLVVAPGWGVTGVVGTGYSFSRLPIRLGLSLSPVYEQGVRTQGLGVDSRSASQLVWNTAAQLSMLLTSESTLTLTYTDQTLLGPASNVSLSRSLAVFFQQRWER